MVMVRVYDVLDGDVVVKHAITLAEVPEFLNDYSDLPSYDGRRIGLKFLGFKESA